MSQGSKKKVMERDQGRRILQEGRQKAEKSSKIKKWGSANTGEGDKVQEEIHERGRKSLDYRIRKSIDIKLNFLVILL